MAFTKPVYSIVYAAISQFLPTSISYKAEEIQQTKVYRHYEKNVELRSTKPAGKWFSPIIIKRREVDLTSNYYVVNSKDGALTKFYTDFGKVEMNYNPLYNSSDSDILNLALQKCTSYPYNHTYHWDTRYWSFNGKTDTYSPNVVTVITN